MERLDQLNEYQRDVVLDLDHHLLINAPAGTGKTKTLAYRTAHIIASGRADGAAVLCLTFTNRACKELKKRIIAIAHENGTAVPVKTIHGFCYGLIREESKRAGIAGDFLIYDDEDCKALLRDMDTVGFLLHSDVRRLQKLCDFIETIKKERIRCGGATGACSYEQAADTVFHQPETMLKICRQYDGRNDDVLKQWLATNGAAFVQEYDSRLAENHVLDFSDLITRAYVLLGQEEICRRWQHRYTYISIDEMQDTSTLEYALLSRLFPGRIILLCGDYFQTIYGWRGSDPRTIVQQFEEDYHPRHITFTINYRSTQTLLHAAEQCLTQLFGPAGATASGTAVSPENGSLITIHQADTFMDEGRWIFRQLQELEPQEAVKACIMTRTNRCNKQIWNSIRSHNETLPPEQRLPFTMADQFQLFKRQESKDVIAFLRLLLNRHDNGSLKRIVARFAKRIGSRTLDTIGSDSYRQLGITLSDFVDSQCRDHGDPFGLLLEGMEQGRIVVFDVETTGTNTTTDEIIQIAAIRLHPDGTVADEFMTFVKASRPVGDSAYIHHISDEELAEKGLEPQIALRQFLDFAADSIIVGHNVTYDLSILYSELCRLHMTVPQHFPYYDTLDIFRRFYPTLENHTLSFLSQHFPISHQPSHDAMDDILATAGILQYALTQDIRPATEQRRAAMSMYLSLFAPIADTLDTLRTLSYTARPGQLISAVMNDCGVKDYYLSHAQERHDAENHVNRVETIRQLFRIATDRDNPAQNARDALTEFLSLTALSNSELDSLLAKRPQIPIITVHQAKGLEFDYVFLACLQDGTFPLSIATEQDNKSDEEKRLFYVALTRSRKLLYLSWHSHEGQRENLPSRFISSIPVEDTQQL
jgi:DNA helicase-2/ATP-dependent DNA helicase PcrA